MITYTDTYAADEQFPEPREPYCSVCYVEAAPDVPLRLFVDRQGRSLNLCPDCGPCSRCGTLTPGRNTIPVCRDCEHHTDA